MGGAGGRVLATPTIHMATTEGAKPDEEDPEVVAILDAGAQYGKARETHEYRTFSL